MIRSSMSAPLVALVIRAVRADPFDHDDPGPISHGDFEPVRVAFHIEDHDALRQEARAGVAPAFGRARVPDYDRETRRGLRLFITERSALFTAAESGKALATSRSSTTTFDPSFSSRLKYFPRSALE